MIAGVGAAPAQAQHQHYDDNDYDHGRSYRSERNLTRSDIQRIGTVNGYSEGYEHGLTDRRERAGFDFQHDETYREAMAGFDDDWRWNNRDDYQRAFRTAYARGYSDGYYSRQRNRSYERSYVFRSGDPFAVFGGYSNDRYSNDRYSNGYPSYRTPSYSVAARAQQMGYTDGLNRGRYDRSIGTRVPKPTGHGAYQTAANGWTRDMGSLSAYMQYYRQSFIQGYNEGFYGRR